MLNLNSVLKKLFVAKINLPEELPQELVDLELYPNTNDCFMLSLETAQKMSVKYKQPKEDLVKVMQPVAGSKFIGAFRDKGSITGIMERYIPVVNFKCENEIEVERLIKALKEMRGENTFVVKNNNSVIFPIDIIANPSTARDNVSALVLQSCMELDGILDDEIKEFELAEIVKMNVLEIANKDRYNQRVLMYDTLTKSIVYDFGIVPILLEDFFWQPKHDNELYAKEKEFSCTYSQFKDGIEVMIPELYKVLMNSLDYERIHENALLLGMELVRDDYNPLPNDFDNDNYSFDDDEDIC